GERQRPADEARVEGEAPRHEPVDRNLGEAARHLARDLEHVERIARARGDAVSELELDATAEGGVAGDDERTEGRKCRLRTRGDAREPRRGEGVEGAASRGRPADGEDRAAPRSLRLLHVVAFEHEIALDDAVVEERPRRLDGELAAAAPEETRAFHDER